MFQNWNELAQCRDLLFMDQNKWIFEYSFHTIRVRHEVRRNVSAIKLHAFHEFEFGLHGLGFFDGNNTVLADFFHSLGNQLPDFLVAVR